MKKEMSEKLSPTREQDNSFGIASVVLALVAILSSVIPAIILSFIALGFAVKQKKVYPTRWATWGITLAILGLVFALVLIGISFMFPDLALQASQYQASP